MKRERVLIISAIALTATGVIWWATKQPTRVERFYQPDEDEAEIMRQAQKIHSSLDMTPVEAFADRAASESYFAQVPIQEPQPGTSQIPAALNDTQLQDAKAKLRSVLAQFVHYRLTTTNDPQRDVDRYIAWRHKRGDVVKPIDDRWLYMPETYEAIVGSALPPNISPDRAFRDVYLAAEQRQPSAGRILAISTNPSETLIVMWWAHTHISTDQPVINHPRGKEYWTGGNAGGSATWFRCALEDPHLHTRVQTNLTAKMGVVVEAADGSRYPLTLGLVWNPASADWMITGLSVVSFELANIHAMIY